MKLTPVLLVDRIEDCLPFWVDKIGFEKTVEVPDGDRLGFVILVKDRAELMIQTWESARKDAPDALPKGAMGAALFIEVEDFADFRRRVEGAPVLLPERVAFYGMREIGVREPGGHFVIFASPEPKS